MQAILEAYTAGNEVALIMEDDMHVLRWPHSGLIATAPPDWDILLLYMMGPQAEKLYMWDVPNICSSLRMLHATVSPWLLLHPPADPGLG